MEYRIISIGALSVHDLWQKQGAARTPHATTTLITSGDRTILVDPALPPRAIAARLSERAGLSPDDITDIFLTNFRPAHRMGLATFPDARWLIFEPEREALGQYLVSRFQEEQDEELKGLFQKEIALLKKTQPAPDQLAPHVDLFPLPGFTPGTCGLLLSLPHATIVVAGDAVPTVEHLQQGRVLRDATDIDQAQTSLIEVVEIADLIIPGHDNIIMNPARRRM